MACTPPLLLSVSAIFAVLGIGVIGLAGYTDNWTEHKVNRREIINAFNREPELSVRLKDAFTKNPLYFPRTYGLIHICFPETVPSESNTFSKMWSRCISNNDIFPGESITEHYTNNQNVHMWMRRATLICYITGFAIAVIGLVVGFLGCMRRSLNVLMATTLLFVLSVLFLATAMCLFHYANYLETQKLDMPPFYKSWEPVLKQTSSFNFGYSYVLAWFGIGLLIMATIAVFWGRHRLKREEEKALCAKQGAYMLPNYYDKTAMMPYGYNTYGGYGAYPYYNQYNNNGYYGYMTYGR